jgi:hypothetical protein
MIKRRKRKHPPHPPKSGIERIVLDPDRLRARITAAGYKSIGQFAKAMNIDPAHVFRMIRVVEDPYKLPDVKLSMLARIVDALNLVSIDPVVRYLPVRKSAVTVPPVSDPDPSPPELT